MQHQNTSHHTIPSQCDGQVEQMNQSIISMMKTVEYTEKKSWKNHINKLAHAYNCTKNLSSTGYTPYFLLIKRKQCLPIDLILSQAHDANENLAHSKSVQDLKMQMREAYQKALQNSSYMKEKDIARRKMINKLSPLLEQGDRVVIRNMSEGEKLERYDYSGRRKFML